jgi:hypothetical protein
MQAAAKRGLQMIKDGHVQESAVHPLSMKSGRKIAAGSQISDDHVRTMAAYHAAPHGVEFEGPRLEAPDEDKQCEDMLWGGPAGAMWSASRVAAMDATTLAECESPDIESLLSADDDFSIEVFARGNLLGPTELQKDEDGLIWAPIIRSGTLAMRPDPKAPGGKAATPLVFVAGHATDPKKEIGLADLVDAFNDRAVEHVTIPKTHGNQTLENTGQIVKMKIADSTIRPGEKVILAGHKFTEPDVEEKVERGSVLSRSCGILHNYTNQETAKTYPHVIEHVALTNKPWVTGMEPYGSDQFSDERQVVPMLLSEDLVIPSLEEGEEPEKPTPKRKLFSTEDPRESLERELSLADIQWGDEPSLNQIERQLYDQLREMGQGPMDEGNMYFSVYDITPTKALVKIDYGDPDGENDAWVIPFSVDDQGVLRLSDFAEWKPVEQQWVTDDDAEQDKQEVGELLHKDNLSAEADLSLSEETLNLATLTAAARKKLPDSAFVFPKTREYPIHDLNHARNALARGAQNETGQRLAAIKSAVYKKYPQLRNSDSKNSNGNGGKGKSNMSLPEDPLERASQMRLSHEPETNQQGGSQMGITPELLERLDLDDNARQVLQRELEESQARERELEKFREEQRRNEVKERITKLSEMGFKDSPGFLREVERILLSDDGQAAIRLDLSDEGQGSAVVQTATQIVDRLIDKLPTKDGKLDLSEKGSLLENPISNRPGLEPEKLEEAAKAEGKTGEQLAQEWEQALGGHLELELAPVGGKETK